MPDGRLVSLPIPSAGDPHAYGNVRVNGVRIGKLVEDLTGLRIKCADRCHLDPDLDHRTMRRPVGWRPAFGQIGAAQSHLAHHGVGRADLFLFFGWFRPVEHVGGTWRYCSDQEGVHVIYGWMQVGEVVAVNEGGERLKPFARHPHLHRRPDPSNTLYLADDRLDLEGVNCSGAGLFSLYNRCRLLTDHTQHRRSVWNLPSWFHYEGGTAFSYHDQKERWARTETGCRLQSVARGQEFVLRAGDLDAAQEWLRHLFADQ